MVDLSKGILPFEDDTFDKIVLDNVLGNFNKIEQKGIFLELDRVLKPNGVLAFNFQNKFYILGIFRYFFNMIKRVKIKLRNQVNPRYYSYSTTFYESMLTEKGYRLETIGDSMSFPLSIKNYQVFPGIFSFAFVYLDKHMYKTFFKHIIDLPNSRIVVYFKGAYCNKIILYSSIIFRFYYHK